MFPLSRWHTVTAVILALMGAYLLGGLRRSQPPPAPVTLTDTPPPAPVSGKAGLVEAVAGPIYVHVTGHVAKPGLYRLPAGARVEDAITNAGGARAEADLDALNLATKLRDGQKLFVPGAGETPPAESSGYLSGPPPDETAALVHADPIPAATQPAAIPPPAQPTEPAIDETSPTSSRRSGSSSKLKNPGDGTVNINTADASELGRLPGVGPSTARKILDYRASHASFKTVEELMEVKGIGPKKLDKMRPFVTLQ